ncbi:MAG: hypothetical protein WC236_02570 [Gallionellaceae bacterium]
MSEEKKWDRNTMIDRRNSFFPEDYAIGILMELSSEHEFVKISHPENGELWVSPKQARYISKISNAEVFFKAPRSSFSVTVMKEKFPPVIDVRRMEDLLWEAALLASQGRLIDGLRKYDVVQFARWPNLTRAPLTPNVMRICALLSRFPSGIFLSQVILNVEEAEINSVCSAAQVIGIVKLLNRKFEIDSEEVAMAELKKQTVIASNEGKFFARLFAKLSSL